MEQNTILGAAEGCNSTFTFLLDSEPLHQAEQSDLAEAVEEERARFRIWAAHIGTFAEQHASLDYRLRESGTVRQLVITQLQLLLGSLSRLSTNLHSESFKDERKPNTLENISHSLNEVYQQDISSEMCVPSLEDNLSSIRGAISRLQRLARAIRLPGAISQTSKAATFSPSAQFESEQQRFETFAIRMIQIKFESATEALQKRLGKANEARRRLFLYRRHHQEILSGKRHTSPHRRPMPVSQAIPFSTSSYQDTKVEANRDESSSAVIQDIEERNAQLPVEKATTFAESKFEPDTSVKAVSSLGGTSIASFFEKSRLPLPPKALHSGDYFECPYCCQFIPVKFLEKKNWRKHLVQDLEPYVCLFEDCQQPDMRFRDQNQWILHSRSHAMRWSCRLPGHLNNQRQMTFVVEKEYTAHLKQHSNAISLSDAQIQLLAKQSGRPDPVPIKVCPLCHDSFDMIRSNAYISDKHVGEIGSSQNSSALTMYKHVASHLMFIASYSLPWSDDVDENIGSNIGPSLVTESNDSDQSSQQWAERTPQEPWVAEESEPLKFEIDNSIPENYQKGEWDFLPDELYDGQENDKKLKAFMDRATKQTESQEKPASSQVDMISATPILDISTMPLVDLPCFLLDQDRIVPFIGRQATLNKIDASFLPAFDQDSSGNNIPSFALVGLGGIGKTAVAIEYAYSRKHHFDVIIWLDATDDMKLHSTIAQAIIRLGFDEKHWYDIKNPKVCESLFRQWLWSTSARWLLILDNAESFDAITTSPKQGNGSILVTSRDAQFQRFMGRSDCLENLPKSDGMKLMQSLTKNDAEDLELTALETIINQTGGLPLAIHGIAHCMSSQSLTYQKTLEMAEKYGISSMCGFDFGGEAKKNYLTTYWGFGNLRSDAISLLCVLSFMGPDNIPEGILINLENESLSQMYPEYPMSDSRYIEARAELLRASLITRKRPTESISVHILVHSSVREMMERELSDKSFRIAIQLVESKWPFQSLDDHHYVAHWIQCQKLAPHVLHMFRTLEELQKVQDMSLIGELIADTLNEAGFYLLHEGDLETAALLSQVVIRVLEQIPSPISEDEKWKRLLRSNYALRGLILSEMNQHESSLNFLLTWFNMLIGESNRAQDRELGYAYYEVGRAYGNLDRFEEAIKHLTASIGTLSRILLSNEAHKLTAPKTSLGLIYCLLNKLEDAEAVLDQALREQEAAFGFDDTASLRTSMVLYALGNLHILKQDFGRSEVFYSRSAHLYRQTLGRYHHSYGDVLYKHAKLLFFERRYSDAGEMASEAQKIFESKPFFRNRLARTHYLKSKIYDTVDRRALKAEELARAMDLLRQLNPDYDPDNLQHAFDMLVPFQSR